MTFHHDTKFSVSIFIHSRTSMARTPMARLLRVCRTRSEVPWKKSIAADLGKFRMNSFLY